jgi:hypothetical protein
VQDTCGRSVIEMTDEKDILQSIELAERLARREECLSDLKQTPILAFLVKKEEEMLREIREEVAKDIVATELLPQARIIVRMTRLREKFIEDNTVIGYILKALEKLNIRHSQSNMNSDEISTFTNEIDKETWRKFQVSLKDKDIENILSALRDLMVASKVELMYTRLPPVPNEYVYDDQAYRPEVIH